jgi:predicted Rossmann-fold nucleotide-binding protein
VTRAVVVSGSRHTAQRPDSDYDELFAAFLAPFVTDDGVVYVGGAVGIDSLALRWLARQTRIGLQVVVPGTVGGQPDAAQAAIAEARSLRPDLTVTELPHPEHPSAAAYHARNRWMVDRAQLLVAFPYGDNPASGTQYTITYAASRRLPRMVVPI